MQKDNANIAYILFLQFSGLCYFGLSAPRTDK